MENNSDNGKLNILFVSAECVPFASNSGVADMCYALPKYLSKNEELDVRVVLPLYSKIPDEWKSKFTLIGERTVELAWRQEYCGVYEFEHNGIFYYFIDNKQYFDRPELFGYEDDIERFSYFSKAVLDMLPMINFFPDVIHTNDWQSGMVCTFLKVLEWQNPKYEHIKTLHNVHGLEFQGRADFKVVKDLLNIDEKFGYLFDYFGGANLMKASLLCADRIVAVSESYKEEIKTEEHGCGLADVLRSVDYKLSGIINGIDYEYYNTMTDKHLAANFDKTCLELRGENKLALQKELGLEENVDIPLYSYIGFMSDKKGWVLLPQVLDSLVGENGAQFVALGKGWTEHETFLNELKEKYPGKVAVVIGHERGLAKKVYAAADFLFAISNDEPCGLCPMIANRYGALPIVYQTGGLKDNFSDFKYQNGNAYILKNYDLTTLQDLIQRTLRNFGDKEKIHNYILAGIEQDFDIKTCAEKYTELYKEM